MSISQRSQARTLRLIAMSETEAGEEAFNQAQSANTAVSSHGGYPYLGFAGTKFDALDVGLGADINPVPVYCELRPA